MLDEEIARGGHSERSRTFLARLAGAQAEGRLSAAEAVDTLLVAESACSYSSSSQVQETYKFWLFIVLAVRFLLLMSNLVVQLVTNVFTGV